MKPSAFTLLSAISLLLCAATVVAWVRSHHTRHLVAWGMRGQHCQFASARGRLWVSAYPSGNRPSPWIYDRHYLRSPHVDFEHALADLQECSQEVGAAWDIVRAWRGMLNQYESIYDKAALAEAEAALDRWLKLEARVMARWQVEFAARNGAARLGFRWHFGRPPFDPWYDFNLAPFVAVPYWFLCTITLAIAIVSLVRRAGLRARLRRGGCPSCNYDLRATPTRCPECGLAVTTPTSTL